jgi:hypothetical protein
MRRQGAKEPVTPYSGGLLELGQAVEGDQNGALELTRDERLWQIGGAHFVRPTGVFRVFGSTDEYCRQLGVVQLGVSTERLEDFEPVHTGQVDIQDRHFYGEVDSDFVQRNRAALRNQASVAEPVEALRQQICRVSVIFDDQYAGHIPSLAQKSTSRATFGSHLPYRFRIAGDE